MSLCDVLDQVVPLLKSRGRVTYRALKREFNLDDDFIEAGARRCNASWNFPLSSL